jgi:predicted  nucleic acid-binding Zn-ribbon protein
MNPVFHLYQLQKIDNNISRVTNRITKINVTLNNNLEILASKRAIDEKNNEREVLSVKLSEVEAKIQEKRNKLEFAESSLYSGTIKNPKELQDLQKEINSIKPVIAGFENDQLDLMLQVESIDETVKHLESEHKFLLTRIAGEHQVIITERETLTVELSKNESEKIAVLSQIPTNMLEIYRNLREKKAGVAVALIDDQSCSICGSALTPAQCQSARSQSGYQLCPSCGRILYSD